MIYIDCQGWVHKRRKKKINRKTDTCRVNKTEQGVLYC